MRGEVLVTAQMADGTIIEEVARTFQAFTALVLAFRRDPECVRVVWEATASDARAQAA